MAAVKSSDPCRTGVKVAPIDIIIKPADNLVLINHTVTVTVTPLNAPDADTPGRRLLDGVQPPPEGPEERK